MMGDFIDRVLVAGSIALYLLGRICDDITWYYWPGIPGNQLEVIGIIGLACSAVMTVTPNSRSSGSMTPAVAKCGQGI